MTKKQIKNLSNPKYTKKQSPLTLPQPSLQIIHILIMFLPQPINQFPKPNTTSPFTNET
jgi:hypothetical protein